MVRLLNANGAGAERVASAAAGASAASVIADASSHDSSISALINERALNTHFPSPSTEAARLPQF